MLKKLNFESNNLLKDWRDERAFRVGRTISWAALFIGLFSVIVDINFKMPPIVLMGDALLIFCCSIAIYFSKRSKRSLVFTWAPLYLGIWCGACTSLLVTGGINSPFVGSYIALLFIGGLIIQTKIRSLWVMFFAILNLAFWFLSEIYFPHSFGQAPPVIFNFIVNCLIICGLMVYVYEFLKTEGDLVMQIIQRYEELERAREQMAKEERANAAKSAFLANISHELRTPLGAIMGYADLLREEDVDSQKRKEFSNTILRNGQQLAHLVNDLLDLSKVEAGKVDLENIEFNTKQTIVDVIELLKLQAQKKGLQLNLVFQDFIPDRLISDPSRIKQVLMNVIGNAIKFTQIGEVNVQVSFSLNSSILKVAVEDTGLGLSEEEQKKLFKPFSQADVSVSRKFGGTGLGLSLSQLLARLMGGDLFLEWSVVGRGSQFVFCVPVRVSSSHQDLSQAVQNKVRDTHEMVQAKTLNKIKILLVDDTFDNQKLVSLYLEKTGALVDLASDGFEAVQLVAQNSYDLILMDVQMPVMDGLQAATLLRQSHFSKPIIALTAHAMKEDRDRCLAAGFDDYLTKPIDREILVDKIRAVTSLVSKMNPVAENL